ncbi:MAG: hypothetical protein ACPGO3_00410 [Magnetospiraceae bacterium]
MSTPEKAPRKGGSRIIDNGKVTAETGGTQDHPDGNAPRDEKGNRLDRPAPATPAPAKPETPKPAPAKPDSAPQKKEG